MAGMIIHGDGSYKLHDYYEKGCYIKYAELTMPESVRKSLGDNEIRAPENDLAHQHTHLIPFSAVMNPNLAHDNKQIMLHMTYMKKVNTELNTPPVSYS